MTTSITLSAAALRPAVDAIPERAENLTASDRVADVYVDTALVPTLVPLKNQVIYGRRGTGKTHLLLRVDQEYRNRFDVSRVLAVYVDGRHIRHTPSSGSDTPPVALLIAYRRLLDEVISALVTLLRRELKLGFWDKVLPRAERKARSERVLAALALLRDRSRFGALEPAAGGGTLNSNASRTHSKSSHASIDAELRARIATGSDTGAKGLSAGTGVKAGASLSSSQEVADSLRVTYDMMLVLDFRAIASDLIAVLDDLKTKALVILFDEWSAIPLALQPALADMIRSTLGVGGRVVVKFGCIPFETELSTITSNGDRVGYVLGEEVFVDADLDRLFSAYTDIGSASVFLLSVLHRHLANENVALAQLSLEDALAAFNGQLFKDAKAIGELVRASAGVPRDFLRLFVRAFRSKPDELALDVKRVRDAIHEVFTQEKSPSFGERDSPERLLFDAVFHELCLKAQTPYFFVSTSVASHPVLRTLWKQRAVHLLQSDYFAFADGAHGVFDIYIMDYGRFVSMRSTALGEKTVRALYNSLNLVIKRVVPGGKSMMPANADPVLAKAFSKVLASVGPPLGDFTDLLENVAPVVADRLLPTE